MSDTDGSNGALDPAIKSAIATHIEAELDARGAKLAAMIDKADRTRWAEQRASTGLLETKVERGFKGIGDKIDEIAKKVDAFIAEYTEPKNQRRK